MASFYNDFSNTIVKGTGGKDYIQNYYGENVRIYGNSGNDTIKNSGERVTIYGGAGKDSVSSIGDNVRIYGGAGDDSIYNSSGDNVTLDGGAGNDFIYNSSGDSLKIYGGAGNDFILSFFDNITLTGGKGNDSITIASYYSKNNVVKYAKGDGNDTITGFNSDDTLHITKGSYKVSTKNNDVIVKVSTGKIILKDAVGHEISIKDSKGKVTTKTYGSASSANLFEENNFATADSLSDIVAEKSVGAFENISTDKLTHENDLITYSEK